MSWRLGERKPRSEQAPFIIKAAKGRIDYAGIYGNVEKAKKGRAA